MKIGMSLPTMARNYTRASTVEWAKLIDTAGLFSSISCGERITFHNPEMIVTISAAAALTDNVEVFVNLIVLPTHQIATIAKQMATLDNLSSGRLTVGVGIGGRDHDYQAKGVDTEKRHQRLDDGVAEMRRIWGGEPPFDGASPIGPPPVQGTGIPLLAGAMGPKALARAAKWADGVSGFALTADANEMAGAVTATRAAWTAEGRSDAPTVVSGCFYALGVDDAQATVQGFTYDYLEIFGRGFARQLADECRAWNPDAVLRALDDAEAAGVDEFILVPGTVDLACLEATIDLLASR